MDVVNELASFPEVIAYFAVLGFAMHRCVIKVWRQHPVTLFASCGLLFVTWFYIMRWTLEYKRAGGGNLFDDAYADVLKQPHFGTSAQLLTWVVVASCWSHDAPICYLLFGMLGAMSSAFLTWLPVAAPSGRMVPVSFAASAAVSLYAISQLAPSEGKADLASFGWWLKVLHLALLSGPGVAWLRPSQYKIDGTLLYGVLAVVTCGWHVSSGESQLLPKYAVPTSDCQISITVDLVGCSLITLAAVYRDSGGSVARTSFFAFLAPFISPAAVLALHMAALHFTSWHSELVSKGQRYCADRLHSSSSNTFYRDGQTAGWTNLGLWNADNEDYGEACERLAACLAEAARLKEGDAVLSVGCGSGEELHFIKNQFKVRHITGVDPWPEAARLFAPVHNVRLLCKSAGDIGGGSFPRGYFNKIISLDNIYHYPNKEAFFADAATLLSPPSDAACGGGGGGGCVAVTDIVMKASSVPTWLRCVLCSMGVQASSDSLWNEQEYRARLARLGFTEIKIKLIGQRVLHKWLPPFMLGWLDYAVISATVPSAPVTRRRQKVAIIGSGLAGLSAAHALTTSGDPVDVTVFESGSKPGLSGNATKVCDTVVDIPLRMIGHGYYTNVEELARTLDVEVVEARTDCTFYRSSEKSFTVGTSSWVSRARTYLRTMSMMKDLSKFDKALNNDNDKALNNDEALNGNSEDSRRTFGEWMDENDLSTEELASNNIVWAMMGQLSWMLSCTYDQVRGYPAKVILDFIRALQMGMSGIGRLNRVVPGSIVRVSPSIDTLQLALAYGSDIVCNTRVAGIDGDTGNKVINGVSFDAVIVATEAMAVKHVLANKQSKPLVFDRVQYQPSSIVLHTDTSAMPPDRKSWQALNVEIQPGSPMSQLTVWLNEYYPNVNFPEDTFETWNAFLPMKGVTKEVHFQRVVHSEHTPQLLKEIEAEQGKGGIYFAGSYSVYGMGLLEQAAISGKKTAARLLADLKRP